jgi:hypothetical protein
MMISGVEMDMSARAYPWWSETLGVMGVIVNASGADCGRA